MDAMDTLSPSSTEKFTPEPGSFRWNVAKKDTLGDVIGLTTADMDFDRTPGMEQVIVDFAKTGCLIYPTQHPKLAPVTLNRIHERYQATHIHSSDVVFFPSVVTGMNALLWALNHNHAPYTLLTPNYPPLFHLAQPAKVLEVPLLDITHEDPKRRGRIDFALLEQKMLAHQSKILLISNPSNPLGKIHYQPEIDEILAFATKHAISVISDEIWIDWTFDTPAISFAKSITAPPSDLHTTAETEDIDFGSLRQTQKKPLAQDCCDPSSAEYPPDPPVSNPPSPDTDIFAQPIDPTVAVVMAVSKTFNLGGMNCAYVITKNRLLKKRLFNYLKFYCTFPSQICQHMLIHLYEHGDETFNAYQKIVAQNRAYLADFCANHIPQVKPIIGEATHVVWLDATQLPVPIPAAFFLEEAKVHLFHGSAFGSGYDKFMRINLATHPHILKEALTRMERAVKTL